MISSGNKLKKRLNTLLPHAADAASFAIIDTDISGFARSARNRVVAALEPCSAENWKF